MTSLRVETSGGSTRRRERCFGFQRGQPDGRRRRRRPGARCERPGAQPHCSRHEDRRGSVRLDARRGKQHRLAPGNRHDGALWFADPTRHVVGRLGEDLQGGIGTGDPGAAGQDEPGACLRVVRRLRGRPGIPLGRGRCARPHRLAARPADASRHRDDPAAVRSGGPHRRRGGGLGHVLLGDTVARIDPARSRIVRMVRVGRGARGVAVGLRVVWVANSIDGTVSRIDPKTNRVVATIPVGHEPGDIAVGPDGVWVTTAVIQARRPGERDDRHRRALRLQGPLLEYPRRHARRGRSRSARARRQARRARSHGRCRGRLDRRASGPARLRLLRRDDRLGARRGATARRRGRRSRPDRPARREPGPRASGLRSTAAGGRVRQRHVVGPLLDPAPNFFSFHSDGAGWTAGLGTYAYRTLGWRHAVSSPTSRTTSSTGHRLPASSRSSARSEGTITKRVWVPAGTQDFSA